MSDPSFKIVRPIEDPINKPDIEEQEKKKKGPPSLHGISEEKLKKYIELPEVKQKWLLYGSGQWYKTCRYYAHIMSPNEARLMDFLINWKFLKKVKGDWFFCRASTITDQLKISDRTQAYLVKVLKKRGFIDTKSMGLNNDRYFKINYAIMIDAIVKGKPPGKFSKLREDKKSKKTKSWEEEDD